MADELRAKIRASVSGMQEVEKLKNSMRQLGSVAKPAALDINKLRSAALKLGNATDRTENELRTSISVLTDLRANVSLTSKRYQLLTRDINKAEAALAKSGASGKGAGNRFGRVAKGLGAVAGSAVFGGPEGAIGSGIGLALGGPAAALAGGAIGAQVGQARKAIASTAEYSAALGLQRKALKLVINDTKEYSKSQAFLELKSKKLAIPQDVITRQFTALTASVKGAGHSVEDAEKVFESIASGIRGTGGSLEDMKSAMRATSQVFSKGKVSAEELRQQLGERLPGAFTIFAQSMDKTPAELDKALEQGKVTLDDFMKFSETLFKKYGKNAEILAQGPEAAGDRLSTSMSVLKDNVGKLLTPIGANFQDTFAKIVDAINPAIEGLVNFQQKLEIQSLEAEIARLQETLDTGRRRLNSLSRRTVDINEEESQLIEEQIVLLQAKLNKILGIEDAVDTLTITVEEQGKKIDEYMEGVRQGIQGYVDGLGDVAGEMKKAVGNALQGLEDQLVNFVTTGKLAFKDLARSIIADMTRIVVRQQILKPILGAFGFIPTINALGNVYAKNGIQKFARGGIVDKPTVFPFAKGVGLMGEAGPEAILPLRRGKGGRLGVESSGTTNTSVVVNVDASGTDVQGNDQQANQLGQLISIAVQSELIKQRRPGGLLTA